MAKRFKKKPVTASEVSPKITTASESVPGPPLSWFRYDWFSGLILILLVMVTYTPVWRAGFVWDDDKVLTANPCIVGLALVPKGQLNEAITQFQEALRLKPDFGPAKVNLAQAQALVRQGDGHK